MSELTPFLPQQDLCHLNSPKKKSLKCFLKCFDIDYELKHK